MKWPFGDVAYADMMQIVDRFDTHDHSDLVGVYETLISFDTVPFESSAELSTLMRTVYGPYC